MCPLYDAMGMSVGSPTNIAKSDTGTLGIVIEVVLIGTTASLSSIVVVVVVVDAYTYPVKVSASDHTTAELDDDDEEEEEEEEMGTRIRKGTPPLISSLLFPPNKVTVTLYAATVVSFAFTGVV